MRLACGESPVARGSWTLRRTAPEFLRAEPLQDALDHLRARTAWPPCAGDDLAAPRSSMSDFVHLHVHSSFSPGWGVHSLEELCAAARQMGLRRLALTDRNGLYGIPHFLEAAREAGIAPIIGAEAVTEQHRAVLLARDEEGYANLCRLLSDLHCDAGFDLPERLSAYRQGLFVLTDDPAVLSPLRRHSPEGLFVELSPGHQMHRALALARELRLPPVATTRAVFLSPEDFELHRVLRAIAPQHQALAPAPGGYRPRGGSALPPEKLADFFPHCPEALENAARIAVCVQNRLGFLRDHLSRLSRRWRAEEAFAELERRAREGALWRYGRIDDTVEARLHKGADHHRRQGVRPLLPGGGGDRQAVAAHLRPGERRSLPGRLLPGDHPRRPDPPQPLLRALPEPRAARSAGHRHRLPLG